jgi:CRISPR-associated helicase Cas3/CRISPR-associated endonuclease Cas3-HD
MKKDTIYYAHSLKGRPQEEWQKLKEHLTNVAELARHFAEPFGAGDWAYAAGLWHDIGKYSPEFQERISGKCIHVDHSTGGAKEAVKKYGGLMGKILAYAIAGHHAGLTNGKDNTRSDLETRLSKKLNDYSRWRDEIDIPAFSGDEISKLVSSLRRKDNYETAIAISFFIRMFFSCVVDADRLDAEYFHDPSKKEKRENYPTIQELKEKLDAYLAAFSDRTGLVNEKRAGVLQKCVAAAEKPVGLFSLTVPTGGGKTLSSMAFALNHATKHDLKRIIYVIPYTSIIEQNAEVFREAFGHLCYAVVEHHSNFDEAKIKNEDDDEIQPWELAIENWDAPIIVTTNVQFFESLFSHHAGRCRKLHNIMNSVVILDEAQMLPVNMLYPCLRAIEELVNHYNTTVVLCTATQPALEKSSDRQNFKGLDIKPENEIIGNKKAVEKLYQNLERVTVENLNELSDDSLVSKLKAHCQVLCIVNTRGRARKLYDLLCRNGTPNCFHLSANMCPEHRSEKLKNIKQTLEEKKPCKVISTQVIEAGVDIDFPIVYREIAGIDSIAQAAGRCNRENRLYPEKGKVYVFEPEAGKVQIFRQQEDSSNEVIRHHLDDMLSLDAIREFFELYFWKKGDGLDERKIIAKIAEDAPRLNFPFREISSEFRVIDDYSIPVIIPWRHGEVLVKELKEQVAKGKSFNKKLLRKLQRFMVNVYPQAFAKHKGISIEYLIPESEQFAVLLNMDIYSEECGIDLDDPYFRNPESNIS